MGYEDVRHYPGGIKEWTDRGEPVETGPSSDSPDLEGSRARTGGTILNPAPSGTGEIASAAADVHELPGRASAAMTRRRKALGWFGRALEGLASMSFNRLMSLWLGLVFGCGVAYWVLGAMMPPSLLEAGRPIDAGAHGFVAAVYFSFVDATSLGLGDIVPVGPARLLAIIEGVSALLIFGCVISKLVSHRQEILIEEIHRNAFESRMGRVRTNLHMVLSEIQNINADAEEHGFSADRVGARLESAAMVFGGELQAVHDLLYRPQQAPAEKALEALLANLAACLREISQLIDRMPQPRELSPVLHSGFATIASLAAEICGECVPREYAPELKLWMDRIQQLAHRIAPGRR